MAEKQRKINLLPNKGENLLNQFLGWSLSIGRLLVIITETLALSVFAYRFFLDVKIVDLHDKIKNDSIIVRNFKDGEDTYRSLQIRLKEASAYDATANKPLTILKDIIDKGRGHITFKNIVVTNNDIALEVQSSSATNLSVFTNELESYPAISSVSVENVQNQTSSALVTVSIHAALKGAKPTPTPTTAPVRRRGTE